MNHFIKHFLMLITATFLLNASAQTIDKQSRRIAECEFIYTYTAQLLQMRNNEGASRNILRRASMMTAANMMSNQANGIIADWKVKEFTNLRTPIKIGFDSGTTDPLAEAGRCDLQVMPIVEKIRNNGGVLWGKSFDELQQFIFNAFRQNLGL